MSQLIINNGVLESCALRETCVTVPKGVHTIGTNAFKASVSLEEVRLPETVTQILDNAFKGCRKLKRINFPAGLHHIGDYAFHRCHELERIELPPSVKALGHCAFLFCDHMVSAAIPGVTSLGRQAFFHDLNLKSLEISPDLDPACINDVFMGCSKLEEIRLTDGRIFAPENMITLLSPSESVPEIIKAVAKDMFRTMEIEDGLLIRFLTNLTHVDIPEGITAIGKSCFFDKKGILSVTLPKSLTRIDCRAFRNCINLEKVRFGNDEIAISEDAFKNCTTLKHIELPDGRSFELSGLPGAPAADTPAIIQVIHGQILGNFLISGTMLIEYRGSEERVVVPDGITVIGERAFAGNEAIGRVILPDSLQEIHEEAFADCLMLLKVNLPDSLMRLDASAFENCVKLIRADLPDRLTSLAASVFKRCAKLNEVRLGARLTDLGEMAFYGCFALKAVRLPDTLEQLRDMAFYKCTGLKEITLPGSLRRLGSNAFTLSGIRNATVTHDIPSWGQGVFSQCPKLRVLTLREGVRHIGSHAAAHCPALKYANLPDSLVSMGYRPFDGSFPAGRPDGTIPGTIFTDGQNLSGEVTIPEGITAIAGGAFYENESVTAVHLPKSLAAIGARAFGGCIRLKEIHLPPGITTIEERTFSRCQSLEIITAGGCLERISAGAFYGCTALAGLTLISPAIREIGEDAFTGTAFLDQHKETSVPVILGHTVIAGPQSTGLLHIPEGIRHIAPFAFAGNEAITGCSLPQSLETVGKGAFYGCLNLETVSCAGEIKKIEAHAFSKCVSLRTLSLSAVRIEDSAFSFCTGLTKAQLPDTLYLGREGFLGCCSLAHIRYPKLREAGVRCFEACESLTAATINERMTLHAHAFEDCSKLSGLHITGVPVTCGSYTFSGCTALQTVETDGTVYKIDGYDTLFNPALPTPIKEIYQSSISCFAIDEKRAIVGYQGHGRHLHIPHGIRRIGREVFRNAVQLEHVVIPDSVEEIEARAFHSTPWLSQMIAEDPMVIVNDILIDGTGCSGDVIIPASVKKISGWAFANCYALTSVTYASPRTVTGEYAYRNCFNLKNITVADRERYAVSHISDREKPCPPLVRQIICDCYNCFKTDNDGVLIECTGNISEVALADGITAVGSKAFRESNLLTRVTLSPATETIGDTAFEQCKWLVSVNRTEQVKRIGKQAFSGCFRLQYLSGTKSLEYIGERAFEHCTALKAFVIPEGVTDIPAKAFYRCKSLETISFPASLKTIGSQAFAYCPHLSEADIPDGVFAAPDAFRKAVSL